MTQPLLASRCIHSLIGNRQKLSACLGVEFIDSSIHNLRKAQKFIAPNGGRFFDIKEMPSSGYRLPFPEICVEHTSIGFPMSEGQVKVPYRVVLAQELGLQHDDQGMVIRHPRNDDNRESLGIGIIAFWSTDGDLWATTGYGLGFAYSDLDGSDFSAVPFSAVWLGTGKEPAIVRAQLLADHNDEIISVLSLLALLDCRNVTTAVDPESVVARSVNSKRIAHGKAEIFQYRQVFIDGERHQTVAGVARGTHESPAWHYRRGHIRRLPDRNIWVRSTTVGNPERGIVDHDYTTRKQA
jgi:hypothetical protein